MFKAKKEKDSSKSIVISKKVGIVLSSIACLLSLYIRSKSTLKYNVVLGDMGSITKTLLRSFGISSGRSLIYVGLYGILLTIFSKTDNIKEFYSYYMIALISIMVGSLMYFIV